MTQTPLPTARKPRSSAAKAKTPRKTKTKTKPKTSTRKKSATPRRRSTSVSKPPKAPSTPKKSTIIRRLNVDTDFSTQTNSVIDASVNDSTLNQVRQNVLSILTDMNSYSQENFNISFIHLVVCTISTLALIFSIIAIFSTNSSSNHAQTDEILGSIINLDQSNVTLNNKLIDQYRTITDKVRTIDDMLQALERTQSTQISNFQARVVCYQFIFNICFCSIFFFYDL